MRKTAIKRFKTKNSKEKYMKNLNFKRLGKDLSEIADFFKNPKIQFCDMSVGAKYMWRDEFLIDYVVAEGALIIKESCPDYKDYFYYPLGENTENALTLIEEFCKDSGLPLVFCCIDNVAAASLAQRYPFTQVYNDRNWSDYIYSAESFKTYSGKKLSGQRNHVNKFKRNYPDYRFKAAEESDFPKIREFLSEFERGEDFSMWSAAEEEKKVYDYILNFSALGQCGGLLLVGEKVVALSFGERVGDTLIVHVEKGLKNYEGVYPTMASEFAKAFANDGIKYINREEDCGDMGLRISKLQYHPLEVKEKNFVKVQTLFDKLRPPVIVATERLSVTDIFEGDAQAYCKLYTDAEINKFYGYDYREDFKGDAPSPQYFMEFMRSLKEKREEYSLAVRKDGAMIGEIVIYNFDFFGGAEIGFRFFAEFRGKGYAAESVKAVTEDLFSLKAAKIKCRAFKENLASVKLIEKLGFKKVSETQTQYFYET